MTSPDPNKQAYAKELWTLAALLHGISYLIPMGIGEEGYGAMCWGFIIWEEYLTQLHEPSLWHQQWYVVLGVLVPLLTLLYAWQGYRRHRDDPGQLPPTFVLVVGLVVFNLIIPIVFGAQYFLLGTTNPIWGYSMWCLSFFFFFFGFYNYRSTLRPNEQTLADHLIEEGKDY